MCARIGLLRFLICARIVHVLSRGRRVRTGGKELALELEAKGYAGYQAEAA